MFIRKLAEVNIYVLLRITTQNLILTYKLVSSLKLPFNDYIITFQNRKL